MADEVRAAWVGLEQLLGELRELPQAIQTRLLKGAVASGAGVIRDEARRLAPVYVEFNVGTGRYKPITGNHPPPGTLKAAIYSARLVSECTPTTEAWIVSVRAGKKFQAMKAGRTTVNRDAFYARWIEYGHYTRTPKGPGTRAQRREKAIAEGAVKWVPPQPFMRPAFDTKKGEAFAAIARYIEENLPLALFATKYLKAMAA